MSEKKGKKLVPQLRFKGFTGDWEQCKLGKIVDIFDAKRVPVTSGNRLSGSNPYFGANGIQDFVEGYTHDGDFILIAEDGANDLDDYPIRRVTGRFWANNHVHVVSGHEGFINIFLSVALRRTNIKQLITGGSRAKLTAAALKRIILMSPSCKEQKLIGDLFEALVSLIAAHERKLSLLKKKKTYYLQQIFSQKLRFEGFTDPWEQRKLGDISIVNTGFAFDSKKFTDDGEYDVVTNKNILDQEQRRTFGGMHISISDDKFLEKFGLSEDCILVTMDGANIGVVGRYSNDKAVLAQRVGRLTSASLPFVLQVTKSPKFRIRMQQIAVGNAIKHISLKQISNYICTTPPTTEESVRIGVLFESLDSLIAAHECKLELLKRKKQAYLQKMFV